MVNRVFDQEFKLCTPLFVEYLESKVALNEEMKLRKVKETDVFDVFAVYSDHFLCEDMSDHGVFAESDEKSRQALDGVRSCFPCFMSSKIVSALLAISDTVSNEEIQRNTFFMHITTG